MWYFIPVNSRLHNKTIGFSFFYFIWFFVFLSFIGWIWEVSLHFVTDHHFVNRGILMGPWLPIYGAGGLFLFCLLYRFRKHPIGVFLLSVFVCTVLEYFCSWFMEMLWGIRWWDYSNSWANLNGRICFLSSLSFGIAALLLIYLFIPFFEWVYEKIPPHFRKTVGLLFLILFIADAAYAAVSPNVGNGITF